MLTLLRDKLSGWFAKLLFGILIFVFAFFGIEGYFVASHATWVAKVGDRAIGSREFQDALNRARQQQLQENPQIDAKTLDGQAFKNDVLQGLIQRQLLVNLGDRLGIVVPDSQLRDAIARMPVFQTNGRFDPATYAAVLASNGLTPEAFQEMERRDLAVQVLPQALSDSSILTPRQVDAFLRLVGQTRDFSYVDLPLPQPADATVTPQQVQAYYGAHASEFMTPEQVSVQYVDLSTQTIPMPAAPGDAELRKFYEQQKARFTVPSQYEVAHILISLPKNASAAQKAAALAQADKVDALARAPGADFAALARQYSDDLGSKNQGGALGWLGLGDTDPAFQAAMVALQPGQVSAPVLTADGYHIIRLIAERGGSVKSFDEVKPQLLAEYEKEARNKAYSRLAGKLIDAIDSNPGSLTDAAKALGIPVQTSPLFGRSGGSGLFADPGVIKAAFSARVLHDGNTSDPVTLSPTHMVLLHLAQHVLAQPLPLAQVSAKIRQDILAQRIRKTAAARADGLVAKLKSGASLASLAQSVQAQVQSVKAASRTDAGSVDPALLAAVFKLPVPAAGKRENSAVDLGQGRYALLQLEAVHPGQPGKVPAGQRALLASQLQQLQNSATLQAFLDALRRVTPVKTAPERM